MANEVSIYDPRTMDALIRRMPPVRTFFRDTFFQRVKTFPTKKIDVDFKKGGRRLAPFVHPMIGGKTMANAGFETETYTPPLVAPNKITTAGDLETRLPGEALYSGMSPEKRAVQKLAEDFTELLDTITRREEWMAAQAIFTGNIPIIGEGVNEVIDFHFTNKETLAKKWSAADADPLGDLDRWHAEVQKTGFTNCNMCIMARDVANAFINSAKVQKLLDTRAYDLAVIKPQALPNGLTYIGTYKKLGLDIYQYNAWFTDDWTDPAAPSDKPYVPDGHLAMLSTEAQYTMYYGGVTIIPEGSDKFMTVEGSRVPESWVERRPTRRVVQISAKPLPVPHEVNSWFVAQVL